MEHKRLVINHVLESWTYVNASDRTTATGMVIGDIGRIAFQSDNGTYWRLINSSPVTWQRVNQPGALLQTALIGPFTTSHVAPTYNMAGANRVMTPISSGIVFVIWSGSLVNATASGGANIAIKYGTGTPPIPGASEIGILVSGIASATDEAANTYHPWSLSGLITGLILGTAIWIDLALCVNNASTLTIQNSMLSAFEL